MIVDTTENIILEYIGSSKGIFRQYRVKVLTMSQITRLDRGSGFGFRPVAAGAGAVVMGVTLVVVVSMGVGVALVAVAVCG
ncbi:hypothetical protein ASG93_09240 [Paenibacillus sp. Soil787]|nr:hypothetical protein ASG93_09240 [Paenibacillus sp. Soil787]